MLNILGAEKILNSLIQQEKNVGRWQYRKHDDYDLVSSVCVQIKGDILRGLGLWVDAARNLIKSIIGFRNLPKPDKKGWASSLSLLADAFQYMSLNDFQAHMVQQYELRGKHPLLEAISCVEEAARLSIYSPLFYSKNKVSPSLCVEYNQIIAYTALKVYCNICAGGPFGPSGPLGAPIFSENVFIYD